MSETCPKCGKEMVDIGYSGYVLSIHPPKLNQLHACDDCKVIVTVAIDTKNSFDGRNLKEYEFL
jgi:RNA polymerase subunit RPABC4/transcription elongation factor Spt4